MNNIQFDNQNVTYLVGTLVNAMGILKQEGSGWRFNFTTPVSGLGVDQVYTNRDAAIEALIQAVNTTYKQKAA